MPITNEPWWKEATLIIEDLKANKVNHVEPEFVLAILYDDNGVFMSQRKDSTKPMYLKYQVPYGKVDPPETSLQVVHRETYEETGLSIAHKRFQKIATDQYYDYDMYKCKLQEREVPELTEPHKMIAWVYYP